MPELPEVETVVRTLERQINGCQITDIKVRYNKIIQEDPNRFVKKLIGQHFCGFSRRGKYLLFEMDDWMFVVHLRMEGKFFLLDENVPYDKHTHVIFQLSNGKQLRYHDTRKFGTMEVLPEDTDFSSFRNLGLEPFDTSFTGDYIHQKRKGKKEPIKSFLLDQHNIAGIGNIYANEILFACKIRPGRSVSRITRDEEEQLVSQTRRILQEAIQAGGTTIRSYTSSLGVTGRFQLHCKVHEQKTCSVCGSAIRVKWIRGRSSYYCPNCQKR